MFYTTILKQIADKPCMKQNKISILVRIIPCKTNGAFVEF